MTVSGDLATIDLADLLQNIEAHTRTGTLSLLSDAGEARLHFKEGRVVMLAREGRTPLVEMLVATGHVTQKQLDAARKKQKGTRKPTSAFLCGGRGQPELAALRTIAEHRLSEDVANLIASADGEFKFEEQARPGRGFDVDEYAMQLSLSVAPLVLEATRRVDDWAEIRKLIPSDHVHLRARDGATPDDDVEDPELAETLLAALDGSRNVAEAVEAVPDEPFAAYKLLAGFVRDRVARPIDTAELLQIAADTERDDPERARVLVQRGLDAEPQNTDLLQAMARVAERLNRPSAAVDALKLLAHVHLEQGRPEAALLALTDGKRLAPSDPSLWQRSLQLALTQGRREDAVRDGLQLVAIYRAPGLHPRAREVLDRLLTVAPDELSLHVEFARSCVDCGRPQEGVQHLTQRARALVADAEYLAARTLFEEVLAIAPDDQEATLSIERIDSEEFARRAARRRRARRFAVASLALAVFGTFATFEVLARSALLQAHRLIGSERMIERGLYDDAIAVLQQVRTEHPMAVTSWFELPAMAADLQQRRDAAAQWPAIGR
ncbi:MAG: DUF4388 domain-containing protein [Planctomycetes bacterium]|nr:DUF4388 domain-containing protein [Planctomycetota bacterium]